MTRVSCGTRMSYCRSRCCGRSTLLTQRTQIHMLTIRIRVKYLILLFTSACTDYEHKFYVPHTMSLFITDTHVSFTINLVLMFTYVSTVYSGLSYSTVPNETCVLNALVTLHVLRRRCWWSVFLLAVTGCLCVGVMRACLQSLPG